MEFTFGWSYDRINHPTFDPPYVRATLQAGMLSPVMKHFPFLNPLVQHVFPLVQHLFTEAFVLSLHLDMKSYSKFRKVQGSRRVPYVSDTDHICRMSSERYVRHRHFQIKRRVAWITKYYLSFLASCSVMRQIQRKALTIYTTMVKCWSLPARTQPVRH